MPVQVRLTGYLQPFADGRATVELKGAPPTVREALRTLFLGHPGLRDRVLTEEGQVRQHVNIFVGDESIRYTGELETPLIDGALISILPAISGG